MTNRDLRIGGELIGDGSPCWIIAEIGHNHQGDVAKARELFRQAKECGANAVKLQKRENRTLYTGAAFDRPYDNENSFGATYGEHREALEFGEAEYVELLGYARELGITMFSTAFDHASVDFLARLDMPAIKIASGDLRNTPLLRYAAELGKPMIVSTGGGAFEDVQRAYDTIMPINSQLAILQCTAAYPAPFETLGLGVIGTFRAHFPDVVVGYSGHDNGIAMALVAYVMGARIVEKHFTLNRAMKGTDHAFSLEPQGLRKLVRDLRRAQLAIGNGVKQPLECERAAILKMGKKLVVRHDLPAGHVLLESDIAIKSPGDGLPPYELENVLGRRLLHALREDGDITFGVLAERDVVSLV